MYPWQGQRQLGSIAGSIAIGISLLLSDLPRPNDGTVSVAATRLEGMSDHLVVKTTHMGLLFSRRAAAQVIAFLEHGRFNHQNRE
jgi:hypothetical protein